CPRRDGPAAVPGRALSRAEAAEPQPQPSRSAMAPTLLQRLFNRKGGGGSAAAAAAAAAAPGRAPREGPAFSRALDGSLVSSRAQELHPALQSAVERDLDRAVLDFALTADDCPLLRSLHRGWSFTAWTVKVGSVFNTVVATRVVLRALLSVSAGLLPSRRYSGKHSERLVTRPGGGRGDRIPADETHPERGLAHQRPKGDESEQPPYGGCCIEAANWLTLCRALILISIDDKQGRTAVTINWSCSQLDLNEIRLIVYQDCERRGRQVLFDSKAVHKIEEVATQTRVRLSASHGADAKHRTSDATRSEFAAEGGVGVVVVVMVTVVMVEVRVMVVMEVMVVVMVMEVMEVMVMEVMVAVTEVMVVVVVLAVVKTEDVPTKTPAKCCQGGGSGSLSSHGSSGGSLPHAKEQLPKYQYTRPASDVNMLGEMMFGSVAMSYKGSTLKIHYIRLQDSFEYINQDPNLGKLNTNQNNLGPCRTGSTLVHSTPVDMPSRGQSEDRDSGIARSGTCFPLAGRPWSEPSL
ncbi:hypothetical protein EI555_014450, partial [Monodon monoceros]